jgi:glutathione S-transferase
MKLLWSSRSPFARKALVAIHELGLADRVKLERVRVAAKEFNPAVSLLNPLGQIPTLILNDGTALFDSPVIVEYLDAQFGTGALVPSDPARRWVVLRLQALGDGLMQLNILRLAEKNRAELASPPHMASFEAKTESVLDCLERETATLDPVSAGSIAVACGLAYLDFRFADSPWRPGRPALAAWFEAMRQRPSMQASEPEDVY